MILRLFNLYPFNILRGYHGTTGTNDKGLEEKNAEDIQCRGYTMQRIYNAEDIQCRGYTMQIGLRLF